MCPVDSVIKTMGAPLPKLSVWPSKINYCSMDIYVLTTVTYIHEQHCTKDLKAHPPSSAAFYSPIAPYAGLASLEEIYSVCHS